MGRWATAKTLLTLGVPVTLEFGVGALAFAWERTFVAGPEGLAVWFMVGLVVFLVTSLGTALPMVVADSRQTAASTWRGALLGLAFGGVLAITVVLGRQPLVAALFPSQSEILRLEASAQLVTLSAGFPALHAAAVLSAKLQAAGDTRRPLLIAGLGLGFQAAVALALALGAALLSWEALAIAWTSARWIELALLARSAFGSAFATPSSAGPGASLGRIAAGWAHLLAERAALSAGFFWFARSTQGLSAEALVQNQLLLVFDGLALAVGEGLAVSAWSLTLREPDRASATAKVSLALALAFASVVAVSLFGVLGLGDTLESRDAGLAAAACAASFPFALSLTIGRRLLLLQGRTRSVLAIGVASSLALRLPSVALVVELGGGLSAFWAIALVDAATSCVLTWSLWALGRRRERSRCAAASAAVDLDTHGKDGHTFALCRP